ncbi:shootin-1-like [Helianthus annuus]|uniref:shootin-1-like n=1 Tax=Helianthus annuus TaxID=4232 RepID=UPI000B908054|nr:shootin-1-like [Helianthus annuus]
MSPEPIDTDEQEQTMLEKHQETEIQHATETSAHTNLSVNIARNSTGSDSDDSVEVSYKFVAREFNAIIEENIGCSIHLDSKSNDDEEIETATGRDQETDQGNLEEENRLFSTTHRGSFTRLIQEVRKSRSSVSSAGVLAGTSVVPPFPLETPIISKEQLDTVLDNVIQVVTKQSTKESMTSVEAKLDMVLEELNSQKSDIKTLSEPVEVIKSQTEKNTEVLKSMQQTPTSSSENNRFLAEFKKITEELEVIKTQVKEAVEKKRAENSGEIIEEINNIIASNNNISDALVKLIKEWGEQKEQVQTELKKVHEEEKKNADLMNDVHSLMKRMHYNVARLAKINVQELMIAIPKEASTQEVPSARVTPPAQPKSAPQVSKTKPAPMGHSPPVPRSEIPRRTKSSLVIMPEEKKRRWEESATSSKKPKLAPEKDSEGNFIGFVQIIDREDMMFPESKLMQYYWSEQDKPKRPLSPVSRSVSE